MFNNRKSEYIFVRRIVAAILLVSFIVTSSDVAFALAPSSRISNEEWRAEFSNVDASKKVFHTIGKSLYLKMSESGLRDMLKRIPGARPSISIDRVDVGTAVYFSFESRQGQRRYFRCSLPKGDIKPANAALLTLPKPDGRIYWKEEIKNRPHHLPFGLAPMGSDSTVEILGLGRKEWNFPKRRLYDAGFRIMRDDTFIIDADTGKKVSVVSMQKPSPDGNVSGKMVLYNDDSQEVIGGFKYRPTLNNGKLDTTHISYLMVDPPYRHSAGGVRRTARMAGARLMQAAAEIGMRDSSSDIAFVLESQNVPDIQEFYKKFERFGLKSKDISNDIIGWSLGKADAERFISGIERWIAGEMALNKSSTGVPISGRREQLINTASEIRKWVLHNGNPLKDHLCNGMNFMVSLGIEESRMLWSDEIEQTWVEAGDDKDGWLIDAFPEGVPGEIKEAVSRWTVDGVAVIPLAEGRRLYGKATAYVPNTFTWREASLTLLKGTSQEEELDFVMSARGLAMNRAKEIMRKALAEKLEAVNGVKTASPLLTAQVGGAAKNGPSLNDASLSLPDTSIPGLKGHIGAAGFGTLGNGADAADYIPYTTGQPSSPDAATESKAGASARDESFPGDRPSTTMRNYDIQKGHKLKGKYRSGQFRNSGLPEPSKPGEKHFAKGVRYYNKGDYTAAVKAFKNSLRYDQNHVSALIYISNALLKLNRYEEVFKYAARCLTAIDRRKENSGIYNPRSEGMVLCVVSHAYIGKKEFNGAVQASLKALELDQQEPHYRRHLANAYFEWGLSLSDPAKATAMLQNAVLHADKTIADLTQGHSFESNEKIIAECMRIKNFTSRRINELLLATRSVSPGAASTGPADLSDEGSSSSSAAAKSEAGGAAPRQSAVRLTDFVNFSNVQDAERSHVFKAFLKQNGAQPYFIKFHTSPEIIRREARLLEYLHSSNNRVKKFIPELISTGELTREEAHYINQMKLPSAGVYSETAGLMEENLEYYPQPFLITKGVPGVDVLERAEQLRAVSASPLEVVEDIMQIAKAMAVLQEEGVYIRDSHPKHVFVTDRKEVHFIDFGYAVIEKTGSLFTQETLADINVVGWSAIVYGYQEGIKDEDYEAKALTGLREITEIYIEKCGLSKQEFSDLLRDSVIAFVDHYFKERKGAAPALEKFIHNLGVIQARFARQADAGGEAQNGSSLSDTSPSSNDSNLVRAPKSAHMRKLASSMPQPGVPPPNGPAISDTGSSIAPVVAETPAESSEAVRNGRLPSAEREALKGLPFYSEMLANYFDHCPDVRPSYWLGFMKFFYPNDLPPDNLRTINKAMSDAVNLTKAEVAKEAEGLIRKWYYKRGAHRSYPYPLDEKGWRGFLWSAVEDKSVELATCFAYDTISFNKKRTDLPEPNELGYLFTRETLVILRYMKDLSQSPAASATETSRAAKNGQSLSDASPSSDGAFPEPLLTALNDYCVPHDLSWLGGAVVSDDPNYRFAWEMHFIFSAEAKYPYRAEFFDNLLFKVYCNHENGPFVLVLQLQKPIDWRSVTPFDVVLGSDEPEVIMGQHKIALETGTDIFNAISMIIEFYDERCRAFVRKKKINTVEQFKLEGAPASTVTAGEVAQNRSSLSVSQNVPKLDEFINLIHQTKEAFSLAGNCVDCSVDLARRLFEEGYDVVVKSNDFHYWVEEVRSSGYVFDAFPPGKKHWHKIGNHLFVNEGFVIAEKNSKIAKKSYQGKVVERYTLMAKEHANNEAFYRNEIERLKKVVKLWTQDSEGEVKKQRVDRFIEGLRRQIGYVETKIATLILSQMKLKSDRTIQGRMILQVREVTKAEMLANRIKMFASEAEREKAKVIIGIETAGWVPDGQKSDMQALTCGVKQFVDTMKRRGMLDNVTVVLGNSEALLTNIANEKPSKSDKVVVLGSEKTLTSDSYKTLEAFKACIDLKELGNLDYISFIETLTVALNLGLGGETDAASRTSHPGIGIETIGERIVRLIPSKKVDINEPSKVYHLQIKELAKQA